MLTSTIFQFSIEDLRRVLARHPDLVVLRVTLRLEAIEEYLPALWQVLGLCSRLQDVEIVGFPVPRQTGETNTQDILRAIYPTVEQIQALSELCPDLNRFHANVLYSAKRGELRGIESLVNGMPNGKAAWSFQVRVSKSRPDMISKLAEAGDVNLRP